MRLDCLALKELDINYVAKIFNPIFDDEKIHNVSALADFCFTRMKEELTPLDKEEPDMESFAISTQIFYNFLMIKTKCIEERHHYNSVKAVQMFDLYIKDTLHDSIYSYFKKRLQEVNCVECGEEGVKGMVDGSVSPWAISWGTYVVFHLERYDGEGFMNKRNCRYPANIDLIDYIEEKDQAKEDFECLYKLIGVIYHDVEDHLLDGQYGAYVLRKGAIERAEDDEEAGPDGPEKEMVWHNFTHENVTKVKESDALSATEGA